MREPCPVCGILTWAWNVVDAGCYLLRRCDAGHEFGHCAPARPPP